MSSSKSRFFVALTQELMAAMNNCYGAENWDPDRFGPYAATLQSSLIARFNKMFSGRIAAVQIGDGHQQTQTQDLSKKEDWLDGLAGVYELLADEYSRSILVKVLSYRLLGHEKVKLPLNTAAYWSQRTDLRSLIKSPDAIQVTFPNVELNHLSLEEIGYPVELYLPPGGVMITFILKQYEYGKGPGIKAQEGDYVIDAGGCWGDTALYFAHTVGNRGKVYTFEFTPENVGILQRNVALNPSMRERVEVVPKALWHLSNQTIQYSPNGPGTSLARNQENGNQKDSLEATTVSIDDFVAEQHLPQVDYIKMDIEGAELKALKGAEETMRSFRPKLAISIYHRDNDFIEIPEYLNGLGLGYEFYLDHFTIYGEETVLFARSV